MGAVTTLAVTLAAAVGAVGVYRFIERQKREFGEIFSGRSADAGGEKVIDYERDPESGVYRPKH